MACTRLFRYGVALTLAFVTPTTASISVSATDADYSTTEKPIVSGEISFEVQNDWTHDTENSSEMNDLKLTIEPSFRVRLTPEWSINAGLTLESVTDATPGKDRAFEDLGLYAKVLTLNYEEGPYAVFAGKFSPNFGIAWDATPGVFGTDFAEDYEISEQLGFGGAFTFAEGRFGTHAVSASVFTADTTFLSESAFENRGRTRKSNGGLSNAESLSSIAVGLNGSEFADVPGLRYHVALAHRKVDTLVEDGVAVADADIEDESGFAVALEYRYALTDDLSVTPLVEWAAFDNKDGKRGIDRTYVTTGVGAEYRGWNAALSYTGRFTETPGQADIDDSLFQISAGYAFDFGLGIDVGWKHTTESDADSGTFGVLASYVLAF